MTRDDALQRANECLIADGYADLGRGCLERRRRFGERFCSAEFVAGQSANARVGDPHWAIWYSPVYIEEDGTLRPTHRGKTYVLVDVATGHTEAWCTL